MKIFSGALVRPPWEETELSFEAESEGPEVKETASFILVLFSFKRSVVQ